MKKYFALLLVLLLLVTVAATVNADGLFGSIVKDTKEMEPNPLPSFSIYSKLPHDKKTVDNDKITFVYNKVPMGTFEGFGVYLEQKNYEVRDSEVVDTAYILEIGAKQADDERILSGDAVVEDIPFVIKYDVKSLELDVIYPATARIQEYAFLNTLNYSVKSEQAFTDSATDHFGNTYAYSLGIKSGSVSVPVNGKYTVFTGTVAYPGEREYDSYRTSAAFTVYGDGKKLYATPDVDIGTYPIQFTVNIGNCKVVEITWSCKGSNIHNNWGYEATIYNGLFY